MRGGGLKRLNQHSYVSIKPESELSQTAIININYKDVQHSVPRSCLCCSPSSSALIPALLSSSNTTALSASLTIPGGAIIPRSALSCWSPGWSKDRPWPPGPSAAPTPGPAPAPTTSSGVSSCFWVMVGFFKAGYKWKDSELTFMCSCISWTSHGAVYSWPAVPGLALSSLP